MSMQQMGSLFSNCKIGITKWIKSHWDEYIYTKTTFLALFMVYMEVFHYDAINGFWSILFGSIGHNEILTTSIANIIVGILIRSDK